MSDVKHTRGPWCVEAVMSNRRNDIVLDYEVPDAGSPVLLASTYDDDDDDIAMPGYISPAEAEANALVMAAAPELLAAAQALLAARDDKASIDGLLALREAVAKAEGRS
jgi:hypothetical protein